MLCSLIVELLELHCLYFVTRRFVFVNWQILWQFVVIEVTAGLSNLAPHTYGIMCRAQLGVSL